RLPPIVFWRAPMALNADNVRVAVTGAVSVGDTSATAPTDAVSPLTDSTDHSKVHEDGLTETRDRSIEQLRAWQNAAVVRSVVTEATITYTFRLIETKKETVERYYATKVQPDGSVMIIPSETGGRQSYVLDVIDGDEFLRAYIPEGEETEVGEQEDAGGAPPGREVAIRAYPSTNTLTPEGRPASVKKWYASLAEV